MNVTEELKFLGKFKKKIWVGGPGGGGGRLGGSGWMSSQVKSNLFSINP